MPIKVTNSVRSNTLMLVEVIFYDYTYGMKDGVQVIDTWTDDGIVVSFPAAVSPLSRTLKLIVRAMSTCKTTLQTLELKMEKKL